MAWASAAVHAQRAVEVVEPAHAQRTGLRGGGLVPPGELDGDPAGQVEVGDVDQHLAGVEVDVAQLHGWSGA